MEPMPFHWNTVSVRMVKAIMMPSCTPPTVMTGKQGVLEGVHDEHPPGAIPLARAYLMYSVSSTSFISARMSRMNSGSMMEERAMEGKTRCSSPSPSEARVPAREYLDGLPPAEGGQPTQVDGKNVDEQDGREKDRDGDPHDGGRP